MPPPTASAAPSAAPSAALLPSSRGSLPPPKGKFATPAASSSMKSKSMPLTLNPAIQTPTPPTALQRHTMASSARRGEKVFGAFLFAMWSYTAITRACLPLSSSDAQVGQLQVRLIFLFLPSTFGLAWMTAAPAPRLVRHGARHHLPPPREGIGAGDSRGHRAWGSSPSSLLSAPSALTTQAVRVFARAHLRVRYLVVGPGRLALPAFLASARP
ncbi:hypothetical protein K438DRAFT_1967479 [Mycena galopus ATCC 62051]|nr:hypothetical protein K438DRAFT_1967479 [Mycena galopus ATCC 62051]